MSNQKTNSSAFLTLITVFFFWGFVAASNGILIPVFKEKLKLEQWQAQMVAFAFYVAYSIGALIYYFISKSIGQDLLNKIGYKNGISIGLCVSALGTLLFIPAASSESFGMFISGLFIVGLGFSLQQTAANPLAINMGTVETGSQRLSLAGGINNLGTTIGPLLVKIAILGSVSATTVESLSNVKIPYLVLGAAFLIVAVIFYFSSVPNKLPNQNEEESLVLEGETKADNSFVDRGSTFKYPQLVLGMIAIFVYVGVEVATVDNLPEFIKQKLGESFNYAPYVSLYWASLMIGRWTAASEAMGVADTMKRMLQFVMPYLAFGVFLLVNGILKVDLTQFYIYAVCIVALIVGNLLSKGSASKQLLIFSCLGIVSLLIGMFSSDAHISVYAFCSVGLFCSTLWPCIFSIAIKGLGKYTSEGSNFLIFMIMGGGVLSLLQGFLSGDKILGICNSYIVGILCFVYLAFYASKAKSFERNNS